MGEFPLSNLSLLVRATIATVRVDDPSLMIENISRYIEIVGDAARGGR